MFGQGNHMLHIARMTNRARARSRRRWTFSCDVCVRRCGGCKSRSRSLDHVKKSMKPYFGGKSTRVTSVRPRGRLLGPALAFASTSCRESWEVEHCSRQSRLELIESSLDLSIIVCDKTTPSTRSSNVSIRLFIMSSVTVPTLKLSTTGDAMPIVGTVGAVKTDCTE